MRNRLVLLGTYLLFALMLVLPAAFPAEKGDDPPVIAETEEESGTAARTGPLSDPEETEAEVYYKETAVIPVYDAKTGQTLTMPLEEYVTHAVMAEMPHSAPVEALRAQAVAARTYCLYRLKNGEEHGEGGARVCTDYAHCMAFVSDEEAAERWGEEAADRIYSSIREAVRATEGQYLSFGGEPIAALFHSSSYRSTENAENVWGGAYPCLVSVPTYEEDEQSTVTVPDEELRALLAEKGKPAFSASLFDEEPRLNRTDTGRVSSLRAFGYEIDAVLLRGELGLRSTSFELSKTEDGFVFTCHGYGHGVGMSQAGAQRLAENGANYREILAYYYVGSELEGR